MSIELCMKTTKQHIVGNLPSLSLDLASNPLYMVGVRELVPGTDNTSLTATINSESANYKYHRGNPNSGSSAYVAGSTNSFTFLGLTTGIGNATGESASVELFIPSADSTALYSPIWASASMSSAASGTVHGTFAGYWSGGTDAITSITLEPSAGVLASGIIELSELALHEVADIGSTYGESTLLARTEAAGESFLDFTISGNYQRYVLVQLGVVPSVDGAWVGGRVGTSGGVQSADCVRHVNLSDSSSSSYNGASSSSGSLTSYAATTGNVSGENFCQVIEIPNPSGQYKVISTQGAYVDNDSNAKICNGAGAWKGGTDQLTTYRALPSSGEIDSGLFLWYGIHDTATELVDGEGNVLVDGDGNVLVII